jgi:hypothetical protein
MGWVLCCQPGSPRGVVKGGFQSGRGGLLSTGSGLAVEPAAPPSPGLAMPPAPAAPASALAVPAVRLRTPPEPVAPPGPPPVVPLGLPPEPVAPAAPLPAAPFGDPPEPAAPPAPCPAPDCPPLPLLPLPPVPRFPTFMPWWQAARPPQANSTNGTRTRRRLAHRRLSRKSTSASFSAHRPISYTVAAVIPLLVPRLRSSLQESHDSPHT